ncbi:DoxX family protein [Opitutales bacterium ASA1]|uniref:DoxX family protein n=1 Tax=Congregicoccus parvus TaxID=3081749 RepID=UPI002B282310|nr:DoxX family protein [Opitutales bacterium ASA1]
MQSKILFFGGVVFPGFLSNSAFAILRVVAGLGMALGHGLGKVPPSDGFIGAVGAMGFPLPFVFAWAAGLAELVGAILVAVGLATRPAALFVTITMGVAAFVRHAGDAFADRESSLLYGAVFLVFTVLGAGRVSVDALIRRS